MLTWPFHFAAYRSRMQHNACHSIFIKMNIKYIITYLLLFQIPFHVPLWALLYIKFQLVYICLVLKTLMPTIEIMYMMNTCLLLYNPFHHMTNLQQTALKTAKQIYRKYLLMCYYWIQLKHCGKRWNCSFYKQSAARKFLYVGKDICNDKWLILTRIFIILLSSYQHICGKMWQLCRN